MNTLPEVIEKSGLSNKEIAHMFGCSIPTVDRWRHGANEPAKATIQIVIEALTKTE